jgi:predicted TPR repeat methyltransferase
VTEIELAPLIERLRFHGDNLRAEELEGFAMVATEAADKLEALSGRIEKLERTLQWVAQQHERDFEAMKKREVETPSAPHEHYIEGQLDAYADAFNTAAQALQRVGLPIRAALAQTQSKG